MKQHSALDESADGARPALPHRLAVVDSHVIQYHGPLYQQLAHEPSIDLTVFYCSTEGARVYLDRDMGTELRWDLDLLSGYRSHFLTNAGSGSGFLRLVNPTLIPALVRGRFDAVLFMTGWAWLSAWIGFAACRISETPIFLFGDSSFVPPNDTVLRKLRTGVLRTLFSASSAFLISGALNADYYAAHGADRNRFFFMPWAIDNDRFFDGSSTDPEERARHRKERGFETDDVVFVYSGKLIERKDPMTLLRALAGMKHRERAGVLFLGDGPLRAELERYARDENLRVHFEGFVNQAALPRTYALADAFVLPSHFDPRATVVNEAMACALPVLITDRCGPSADIVRDGENGFVFGPGDVAALARGMDILAGDEERRIAMASRSREIIRSWSYREDVAGIVEALASIPRRGATA